MESNPKHVCLDRGVLVCRIFIFLLISLLTFLNRDLVNLTIVLIFLNLMPLDGHITMAIVKAE